MPRAKCGFGDSEKVKGVDALVSFGPSLLVDIGFDPKYVAKAGVPPPAAAIKGIWALVDTGATECCIDGGLAKERRFQ